MIEYKGYTIEQIGRYRFIYPPGVSPGGEPLAIEHAIRPITETKRMIDREKSTHFMSDMALSRKKAKVEAEKRSAILKTRDGLVQLHRCDTCGYWLAWCDFDRELSTFFGELEFLPEHRAICFQCASRSRARADQARSVKENAQ